MHEFDRSSKRNLVDRHIGKRLRQARERLGETPQYVARALKLRVVDYLQVEAGNCRLGAQGIVLAAELLRVDIAWFFEGLTTDEKTAGKATFATQSPRVVDLKVERWRRRHKRGGNSI